MEKYEMRLRHQKEGKSVSLVAAYDGAVMGYINVYPILSGVLLPIKDIPKSWTLACWRSIAEMGLEVS